MNGKIQIENVILQEFPFPVAIRYRQMLNAETSESKAKFAIAAYEAVLRSLTLGILGQYLQQNLDIDPNTALNDLAWKLIEQSASVGVWTDVFFEALRIYGGQRHNFFMKEPLVFPNWITK